MKLIIYFGMKNYKENLNLLQRSILIMQCCQSYLSHNRLSPRPAKLPMVPALKQEEELPALPLVLPELPFSAAFLQSQHFEVCTRIWSLSELFKWCLKLRIWLRDLTISGTELKKALSGLLAFHRRDTPLDIVSSSARVVLTISLHLVLFH